MPCTRYISCALTGRAYDQVPAYIGMENMAQMRLLSYGHGHAMLVSAHLACKAVWWDVILCHYMACLYSVYTPVSGKILPHADIGIF